MRSDARQAAVRPRPSATPRSAAAGTRANGTGSWLLRRTARTRLAVAAAAAAVALAAAVAIAGLAAGTRAAQPDHLDQVSHVGVVVE